VRPEVDRAVLSGDFLVVLNSAYTEHHTAMIMIRDILMYMDRVYVAQQQVDPVYSMGMRLFRDNITHHNNIQHQLTTTLLNMIHRERTGEAIDRYAHALTVHTALRSAISTACKMLVNLGNGSLDTYESDFERPFLAQTAEFYKVCECVRALTFFSD
jgi:cullin 3